MSGDEPVACPDPLSRADDDHDDVDVTGDRLIDALLHPLGQRVDRLLPTRQVDQHELRVLRRVDAADLMARRVRLVGDDRDLRSRQRVDERRLAHVRTPGNRDETRLHSGNSHVSGSSAAALIVPTEPSARR